MSHGNGVVAGESLPAMAPDETAIAVPCHLYPAQDVVQDRKQSLAEGASALHDSSANGKAGEAPTKAQVSLAESAVVEAEAKARVAESAAVEADAKAKSEVANARAADANARAAYAEASAKVRIAKAQSLKADISIFKLRRELDVVGEFGVKKYLSVRLSHCLFF